VCRQPGISEATFYVWKKRYANLGVADLRELRQLREENSKLKRLVADLTLDKSILAEIVRRTFEASPPAHARDLGAGYVRRGHLARVPAGTDLESAVVLP
jgi:putative transposase